MEEVVLKGTNGKGSERYSNLELLRIICMLAVIASHYVVNSGVEKLYDFSNITQNMLFLQLWGMWGKTAINVFVLISGYFMCTSQLNVKRFAKIYLELKFYNIAIFLIFLLLGYERLGLTAIIDTFFNVFSQVNVGFSASFLFFYLMIPFYNMLIINIDKHLHGTLILILLVMHTITSTFFFNHEVFSHVGWYITLYFIASYIRLHPLDWMNNNRICGVILAGSILLSYLGVLVVDFLGVRYGFVEYYHMTSNSNKLFALLVSVFLFLFFRNIKMGNYKIINSIASTTFGVFLIHASSDAMREFLWEKLFGVKELYNGSFFVLVGHALVAMILVFAACSVIDLLRIRFIEKPLFKILNKYDWFKKALY